MIEIVFKGKRYSAAGQWDEVSPKQYLQLVTVLTGGMELYKARIRMASILTGIRVGTLCKCKPAILANLLSVTSWVEEDGNIGRQLVPEIYVGEILHGPSGNFENMLAGEFHFADMYYTLWKFEQDQFALYQFIAVIYRPGKEIYDREKDVDGDIRVTFNPHVVDYYANKIQSLRQTEIVAITLCYESWRRQLEENHKSIFTLANKVKAVRYGWFPVFRGIAGGNKYGNVRDVEQMGIQTLLTELHLLREEEREMRKKHPQLFKNE